MTNIGENIKKQRNKLHLTQRDLAKMLYVTPQAISRWELNSVEPSLDTLNMMAGIFNISVDELINGEPTTLTPNENNQVQANSNTQTIIAQQQDPSIPIGKCYECGCDVYLNACKEFVNSSTNEKRYLCYECFKNDGTKYLTKKKMPLKKLRLVALILFTLILITLITINHFVFINGDTKIDNYNYFVNVILVPYFFSSAAYVLCLNNIFVSKYFRSLWREVGRICFEKSIVYGGIIRNILGYLLCLICLIILVPICFIIVPILSGLFFPFSFYKAYFPD